MDMTKLKGMATGALWADERDIVDRLIDAEETKLVFAFENVEGSVWITVSSPKLGYLTTYEVDYLIKRFQDRA